MAVLLRRTYKKIVFPRKGKSTKLKASTLVEALVASVIIIVVFTIASLTLNNIFRSTLTSNTQAIDTRLNKILYLYQYNKIGVNYQEDFNDWDIILTRQTENNTIFVVVEAVHVKTKKKVSKKKIDG